MSSGTDLSAVLIQIAKDALWAPPAVFATHYWVTEWLEHEPYVDPVMHFAGGAAIALCFWHFLLGWERFKGRIVIENKVLLAFWLTVLIAVAWEAMEYGILIYSNWPAGWNLLNTLRDLVLGAGGAALVLSWLRRRKPAEILNYP